MKADIVVLISHLGDAEEEGWEGCLSVPGLRGVQVATLGAHKLQFLILPIDGRQRTAVLTQCPSHGLEVLLH